DPSSRQPKGRSPSCVSETLLHQRDHKTLALDAPGTEALERGLTRTRRDRHVGEVVVDLDLADGAAGKAAGLACERAEDIPGSYLLFAPAADLECGHLGFAR